MNNKIRLLSDLTINQIAAGEVIENPSSVIKELIENAIDAGASNICIEVFSGGFQRIKISDNGSGMSPDDAALCLKRHATSKITNAQDLFSLSTMGFRGEALASIAAICKMTLNTALEDMPAVLLEVEGGEVKELGPSARSRGTTIEVRSLFYNVPARKKFQKSVSASSAEITKIVTQLALAHPEVGFELAQQGRTQFSLPSAPSGEEFLNGLKKRIETLLGKEFLHACHFLEMREGSYTAKGVVADPLYARYNRSGQYLFVNRRPVLCPSISYAVRDAYGTRLSSDRHPVFLLHLSVSPQLIDVNVHPQKKEIRLREESVVKYAIHAAVNNALAAGELPREEIDSFSAKKSPYCQQSTSFCLKEGPEQNFSSTVPEHNLASASVKMPFSFSSFETDPLSFAKKTHPDFSEPLVCKEEIESQKGEELFDEIHAIGFYRHYLLAYAKNFSGRFFLESEGIVWVDLLAAEARLNFETLMRHMGTRPLSQGLLIPLTLTFSRAESQFLKAHFDLVYQLGIQIREIGETVFLVEAIPPFLEETEVGIAIEELICQIQGIEHEKLLREERNRRLAACLCRRVRSRKKSYNLTEADHLIKQLLQAEDPNHCPQGKKILFHLKEEEIESYFSRTSPSSRAVKTFTEGPQKGKS